MIDKHILFLTLRVFSATGGIEKVCRVAGKALHELSVESGRQPVKLFSLYDETKDVNTMYFPAAIFTGFGKHRFNFLRAAFKDGIHSRMVIMSHVNLLLIGSLIKIFSPKTKLVLIAHGIEVWKILPGWKKRLLQKCDAILPVSDFTKKKMMELYQIPEAKFDILNNCLDPFLAEPLQNKKDDYLLSRYGIGAADIVLMTLTRLASTEQYKGYELVLQSVHDLKHRYPYLKYLIVGKYDVPEKARLDIIINRLDLKQQIIFAGFIPDEELAQHYNLADLYIMPSQKEGFGIVFIEAMFYGKPVIAGNKDGSVDALQNGALGILVNPESQQQITDAIVEVLNDTKKYIPSQAEVIKHFGFKVYKEKLRKIIG